MNKKHFKHLYYFRSNNKLSGIIEYFNADYLPTRDGQEGDHAESGHISLCLFSLCQPLWQPEEEVEDEPRYCLKKSKPKQKQQNCLKKGTLANI